MKVLMLGWEFPPYFAGGVGIVCYELTRALAQRGTNVTYLMPSGPRDVHADFVDLLVADNFIADGRVKIAKIGSIMTPYASIDEYKQHYNALLKGDSKAGSLYGHNLLAEIERFAQKALLLIEEMGSDFDVIHAHDWTTFPAAIALKRLTGKPLIVHVHITEFDKTGGEHADPRVYAIEKAGMDAADMVITVSNLVKSRCVHQYYIPAEKVRIVYNAVTQGEAQPFEERFRIKERDKIVLFLGRVTLQKGPDYFLEAARKVIEFNPNVKFVMAGTGDMLPRMIEKAAAMGMANKVIFPGFVNREQGDQLYRMADVFVMPSVSEPFGIVPLEAIAQGTPVIISKQSGVNEVLNSALRVDFWDVDDLTNKILAALSYSTLHQELKMRGSMEVRKFNWGAAAEHVNALYEEAVRMGGG